jgi:hypothetical protein
LPGDIVLPIGMAELGTPGDYDRAKVLVADEREIRRIDDRSGLGTALAVRAMTRLTTRRIDL